MLSKENRGRIRLRVGVYGKPTGLCDTRRLLDDIHELRRMLREGTALAWNNPVLADWRAQTRKVLDD